MFEYAREEAGALGASELAPVHVVLGILRNGDQRAAGGADRERTRARGRAARGRAGTRATSPARRAEVDIRAMLGETAHCARRRGADRIEVEHLLRSALASDDHGRGQLLERLGVAPDRVLAELDAAPPDDADCLEA